MNAEGGAAGNFDIEAAWLRRFQSDAESNLKAFALALREAMPDLVTIEEHKGLFDRHGRITGVQIALGEHQYVLQFTNRRLQASIAMVVRGITLNTKVVDPAEWFRRLAEETHQASEHAKSLSESITRFMGQ
ncbi:MAG TPA: hypothetical protein VN735_02890 [Steroidobacteraceae bacterium]|nr:hypothetical protein [Steroidobacteraceae bacterium]